MNMDEVKREIENMGEIVHYKLEERAKTMGDKTFFYYGEEDRSISFREFNGLANSFAHNLKSMGIEKGDRISLSLLNPLVTTIAMFGIWKIGAVFCPINFNYTGKLLSYQVNDTQPKIIIMEKGRLGALNQVRDDISALPVIVHEPEKDDHDFDPESAKLDPDKKFKKTIFGELLKGDISNPGIALNGYDTANIIYTSGTTGPAKGCVQAFRWMVNYCFCSVKCLTQEDVIYNDLPLYHVGGAFGQVAKAAWAGCTVGVWDRFSPTNFWKRIEKCGASQCILLDVMIPWVMTHEETPSDRLNTLNKVILMPLPPNHNQIARRFGFDYLTAAFGQTESGASLFTLIDELEGEEGTPKELYKGYTRDEVHEVAKKLGVPVISGKEDIKKGILGKVGPLLDVAVLDENDEELGPGKHGQLGVRSKLPYLMLKEYLNKPEATVESFKNFWFHTGDGVYKDDDDMFYYEDRMGGFIRKKGENISSFQVEELLNSHEKIAMSSALPIPAEEGMEDDIAVFVVLHRGAELSKDELWKWIKAEMPKFMWPKHIRFVEMLPHTPTFKVEKYKLKDMILKELRRE